MRHGNGKLINKNESTVYGEWYNDVLFEDNEFTYPNGDIYKGRHANGMKHGQGTIKYASGETYSGYWKYDQDEW